MKDKDDDEKDNISAFKGVFLINKQRHHRCTLHPTSVAWIFLFLELSSLQRERERKQGRGSKREERGRIRGERKGESAVGVNFLSPKVYEPIHQLGLDVHR